MREPPASLQVLYEDNHVVAVVKPVNVPTQADQSRDTDLLTMVKRYIGEKYNKPGDVYIGLVHRLDRPVGGAMLFARTSKAAGRLSQMLQDKANGEIQRTYRAVVHGHFDEPEGTLTDWLLKDGRTHTSKVVREGTPQAKKAILHYMVLKEQNGYSLISVQLETGRSHQIRVQMSHAGHPLVGDQRYGVGSEPGIQIALWSYEMTFLHPVQKKPITVTAPLPDRWPWSDFEA